jgi:hypothetical protein
MKKTLLLLSILFSFQSFVQIHVDANTPITWPRQ